MSSLVVTDPRIIAFYEKNKNVDFQSVNLLFIDLFEKFLLNNIQINFVDGMLPTAKLISESINGNSMQSEMQHKLFSELSDFLNKFRDNDQCQEHNDKHLLNILTKLYSNAEVNIPIKNNASGLIVLKRQGRPNIIIDNRDINTNVTADEIQAFSMSIDEHNCNGIFLSQNSGISSKKNYQIEIHNNNIMVFVHQAQYNPSKIAIAVDIIDQISIKIRQFKNNGEDCCIPKDIMDTINNEYQLFLSQKIAVIEVFKESQKKVLSQIDEIRFPTLDKFLATKYSAPIQKPGLKCDICKSYSANNLKALAAHKRGCIRKNTVSNVVTRGTLDGDISVNNTNNQNQNQITSTISSNINKNYKPITSAALLLNRI
jgi:hypothetical protein